MNKPQIGRIPVACDREGCVNVMHRFPSKIKASEIHFCSTKCRNEHDKMKWSDKLETVKENIGKIEGKQIAKMLDVNYNSLRTQIRKWKLRGDIECDKQIKQPQPIISGMFSWSHYPYDILTS